MLRRRVLDEGTYGADFIMRMRAPSGSFLRSVQRQNSYEPSSDNRMIGLEYTRSSGQFTKDHSAPTADTEVITDANYETSMRAGGGTCIAALAAAARHPYPLQRTCVRRVHERYAPRHHHHLQRLRRPFLHPF